MAFHIVGEVRKKSREQWIKLAQAKIVNVRIWIQENGEAAFVLGLGIGLLVVFLHKLFIFLVAISIIIGVVAYQLSYPESELERMRAESTGNSPSPNGHSDPTSENGLAQSESKRPDSKKPQQHQ